MKQLEIQGQKVFALTVTEGMLESMTQNGAKWFSNGSINCFGLPMGIYTVIAGSDEPEKFVKVFYPDAKIVVWEGAFARGIIGGCKVLTQRGGAESEMWQSAAYRIMQEHGLENGTILLTETAQYDGI